MRYFIVISLVFSFCFLSMRSTLVYSYFKWNQEYITANFCVNRAVKESKCNGNCRLKDMMEVSEQTDQPQSVPIIPNLQVEEFYWPSTNDLANLVIDFYTFISPNFTDSFLLDRLSVQRIFHPPEHAPLYS